MTSEKGVNGLDRSSDAWLRELWRSVGGGNELTGPLIAFAGAVYKAATAHSRNYVADNEVAPTSVTFANGRLVAMNATAQCLDVGAAVAEDQVATFNRLHAEIDRLYRRVEDLKKETPVLRAALVELVTGGYLKHKRGCASGWRADTGISQIGACDCGLNAAITKGGL